MPGSDRLPQGHVRMTNETFARVNPRAARVVEMRFFAGMTMEEVAHVLELSKRTAEADWHLARAWLSRELERS